MSAPKKVGGGTKHRASPPLQKVAGPVPLFTHGSMPMKRRTYNIWHVIAYYREMSGIIYSVVSVDVVVTSDLKRNVGFVMWWHAEGLSWQLVREWRHSEPTSRHITGTHHRESSAPVSDVTSLSNWCGREWSRVLRRWWHPVSVVRWWNQTSSTSCQVLLTLQCFLLHHLPQSMCYEWLQPVIKVALDARSSCSSCTSDYRDPAFPHLNDRNAGRP